MVPFRRVLAQLDPGTEPSRQVVRVPAAALFRGDNLLQLVTTGEGEPAARLHQLTIRPVP